MQEIADEAGINKALLHYYFRSKNRLFEAVFEEAFEKFMPHLQLMINSDIEFFESVKDVCQDKNNILMTTQSCGSCR